MFADPSGRPRARRWPEPSGSHWYLRSELDREARKRYYVRQDPRAEVYGRVRPLSLW